MSIYTGIYFSIQIYSNTRYLNNFYIIIIIIIINSTIDIKLIKELYYHIKPSIMHNHLIIFRSDTKNIGWFLASNLAGKISRDHHGNKFERGHEGKMHPVLARYWLHWFWTIYNNSDWSNNIHWLYRKKTWNKSKHIGDNTIITNNS